MRELSYKALGRYYKIVDPSWLDTTVFNISRLYTEFFSSEQHTGKKWLPWDMVVRGKIALGKIPSLGKTYYSSSNQHEDIIHFIERTNPGKKLKVVISLISYPELAAESVVKPKHWFEKNVKHIHVPMLDFTADLEPEIGAAILEEMEACIEQGDIVYLHCKAGRSRSGMMVAAYLQKWGGDELLPGKEIKEIEAYLKQDGLRPQVDIGTEKCKKAHEIADFSRQSDQLNLNKVMYQSSNKEEAFKELISSLQLKNAIIHFLSFKNLAIYACNSQGLLVSANATHHIQTF